MPTTGSAEEERIIAGSCCGGELIRPALEDVCADHVIFREWRSPPHRGDRERNYDAEAGCP